MAGIKRFEDIEAWQNARRLTCEVYLVSGAGEFAKDLGLRDQIRGASVSAMSIILSKQLSGFIRYLKQS